MQARGGSNSKTNRRELLPAYQTVTGRRHASSGRVLVRSGRGPGGHRFFCAGRNRRRGARIFKPWDELHDPLSSFVPELSTPLRRGFLFPEMAPLAGVRRCVRGRGTRGFAACCPPSSSRYPEFPLGRAARDACARYRPRSTGRLHGLGVSWLFPERFEPYPLRESARHPGRHPHPDTSTRWSHFPRKPVAQNACFGRFLP